MSSRERLLNALEQDLHSDHSDCRQLQAHLDDLHQQLLRHDASAVERLNGLIQQQFETLGQRATRRSRILSGFGLSMDQAGMQRLLASCQGERRQRLETAWQSLEQLMQACQHSNQRNGRVLAMQSELISQLIGQDEQANLYSPTYL